MDTLIILNKPIKRMSHNSAEFIMAPSRTRPVSPSPRRKLAPAVTSATQDKPKISFVKLYQECLRRVKPSGRGPARSRHCNTPIDQLSTGSIVTYYKGHADHTLGKQNYNYEVDLMPQVDVMFEVDYTSNNYF